MKKAGSFLGKWMQHLCLVNCDARATLCFNQLSLEGPLFTLPFHDGTVVEPIQEKGDLDILHSWLLNLAHEPSIEIRKR